MCVIRKGTTQSGISHSKMHMSSWCEDNGSLRLKKKTLVLLENCSRNNSCHHANAFFFIIYFEINDLVILVLLAGLLSLAMKYINVARAELNGVTTNMLCL